MEPRTFVAGLLILLAPLAGCIEPQEPREDDVYAANVQPPEERIQGMTAQVEKVDKVAACPDQGIRIPPAGWCAERTLLAQGRIGESTLDVLLRSTAGSIRIRGGEGDAWSFRALVKVQGATEEEAREGLDTAWTWTHERNGRHVLEAGPAAEVLLLGPRFSSATYEVTLPAWVLLNVQARTSAGSIGVEEVLASKLDLETSSGSITIEETSVDDLRLATSNGRISAQVSPRASGAYDLQTSNGQIKLELPTGARRGYDIEAQTSNGRITIDLPDGGYVRQERDGVQWRTDGFESREVQTKIAARTSNGQISIAE